MKQSSRRIVRFEDRFSVRELRAELWLLAGARSYRYQGITPFTKSIGRGRATVFWPSFSQFAADADLPYGVAAGNPVNFPHLARVGPLYDKKVTATTLQARCPRPCTWGTIAPAMPAWAAMSRRKSSLRKWPMIPFAASASHSKHAPSPP